MLKNISTPHPSPSLLPKALKRSPRATGLNSGIETVLKGCNVAANVRIGLPAPFSIIAGLKLKDSRYKTNDSYVVNSPLRQSIANKISKEPGVSEAYWCETAGIVELGLGISQSIPVAEIPGVGLGFSADFGFDPSGLLCYRYSRPARFYNDKTTDRALEDNFADFPASVPCAEKLPLGHEVELCGVGKLMLNEGFSLSEGAGVQGICKIGVGATLAASQTIAGEYGVSVLALDGEGQVRVSINKSKQNLYGFGLDIRAGLLSMSVPLPSFGEGALASLAEKGGAKLLGTLACSFGSAVFHADQDWSTKNSLIASYDIDLSSAEGQKAYCELLRLNPCPADKLSKEPNSGVSKVTVREKKRSSNESVSFKALNIPLYSKKQKNINNVGVVYGSDKSKTFYHDRIYNERFDNIITGQRNIEWDGITVKDPLGEFYTYYRFDYEENNKLTTQDYVDRHCHLAKCLNISPEILKNNKLIEMNDFLKVFSSEDNLKTSIELFFTEAGVKTLMQCDAEQGMMAFLKSNNDFGLSDADLKRAHQIFVRYQNVEQSWWNLLTGNALLLKMKDKYHALTDRDLTIDYGLHQKAQDFGKLVGEFCHANNAREAREFFALLGQRSDMDYTEILLAITALAGRENLLVHELALNGGGVTIQCNDEGQIYHPTQEVNMFNRNQGLCA